MTSARAILDALHAAAPTAAALACVLGRWATTRDEDDLHAAAELMARTASLARLAGAVTVAHVAPTSGRGSDVDVLGHALAATLRYVVGTGARWDMSGVVPLAFVAAADAVRTRAPSLAQAYDEAAATVRHAYGGHHDPLRRRRVYPHWFAVVHALTAEVMTRTRGVAPLAAAEALATYTAVVTRTTSTTAFAAGRLDAAEGLARRGADVGFRFVTAGDDAVRRGRARDHGENHAVLEGLRARHDDLVWDHFCPPLGFACRCELEPVVDGAWHERALGLAREVGARAAAGFGGRANRRG